MVGTNGSIGIGVFGTANTSSSSIPLDFTATIGQTTFSLPKNAKGVIVVLNRVPQIPTVDYTFIAPSKDIIFIVPCDAGDSVQITPFY